MSPQISVIVPCYNQAQYLDECLQSVLDQTYKNWECIIVNDGSPDNTEEIAKKWVERDSRFKYIYKANGGLSSARNVGLRAAIGEYIQLLDCDDFIAPEKFHLQIIDLQFSDVSICDYRKVNTKREIVPDNYCSPFSKETFSYKELISEWETHLSIPCHCVIFKNKGLLFNEKLKNHEDWVFWIRLFYDTKAPKYNRKILAFYRLSENSMCTNGKLMNKGFVKACDVAYKYFRNRNEVEFSELVRQKKVQLMSGSKLTVKEKIAQQFPLLYSAYCNHFNKLK